MKMTNHKIYKYKNSKMQTSKLVRHRKLDNCRKPVEPHPEVRASHVEKGTCRNMAMCRLPCSAGECEGAQSGGNEERFKYVTMYQNGVARKIMKIMRVRITRQIIQSQNDETQN